VVASSKFGSWWILQVCVCMWFVCAPKLSQPHFWKNVRMSLKLPKWGLGSPSRFPKLQNSIAGVKTPRIDWGVLHDIGKLMKCRCRKWPCMIHLDICSTSYGKKDRESNQQFDSQPLKIRNQFDPCVWRWNVTHHWKDLNMSYKFSLDFIPIRGLSKELWTHKVPGVQTGTVSGLLLGSPWTKIHSDVGAVE